MLPFENGYFIELDEYEDKYGTSDIKYYEEFHDYYPTWLQDVIDSGDVSDKAVLEYVTMRKGEFE